MSYGGGGYRGGGGGGRGGGQPSYHSGGRGGAPRGDYQHHGGYSNQQHHSNDSHHDNSVGSPHHYSPPQQQHHHRHGGGGGRGGQHSHHHQQQQYPNDQAGYSSSGGGSHHYGQNSQGPHQSHQHHQHQGFPSPHRSHNAHNSTNAMPLGGGSGGAHSTAGGGHAPLLQVMDMGLDFKSYQQYRCPDGNPIGNVSGFSAEEVAELFEPTVGLLVTIIHLGMINASPTAKRSWLVTYQALQRLFLEGEASPDSMRAATEAIQAIESGLNMASNQLFEHLLMLLDVQSEYAVRGGQAPSQRRVTRDPRGVLCNLHLSDRRHRACNQEFSCNQLHLVKTGGPIRHRSAFYLRVADTLVSMGCTPEETRHRLIDLLFFSEYGNRVTVRYGPANSWIQFFKTSYTQGRLSHAMRRSGEICMATIPGAPPGRCQMGPTCPGVHLQDPDGKSGAMFSKQMDLPLAQVQDIYDNLADEVDRLLALRRSQQQAPPSEGTTAPSPPSASPSQNANVTSQSSAAPPPQVPVPRSRRVPSDPQAAGRPGEPESPDAPYSPTTQGWAAAVDLYKKEHNGQQTTTADRGLLAQLETRPAQSPLTPEEYSGTPLLAEVDHARFSEENSQQHRQSDSY